MDDPEGSAVHDIILLCTLRPGAAKYLSSAQHLDTLIQMLLTNQRSGLFYFYELHVLLP